MGNRRERIRVIDHGPCDSGERSGERRLMLSRDFLAGEALDSFFGTVGGVNKRFQTRGKGRGPHTHRPKQPCRPSAKYPNQCEA